MRKPFMSERKKRAVQRMKVLNQVARQLDIDPRDLVDEEALEGHR